MRIIDSKRISVVALAFAANDLVNFIGAPMGALSAFLIGNATMNPDPMKITMEALKKPVQAHTLILLGAGAVMTTTLWFSRKARGVAATTRRLGQLHLQLGEKDAARVALTTAERAFTTLGDITNLDNLGAVRAVFTGQAQAAKTRMVTKPAWNRDEGMRTSTIASPQNPPKWHLSMPTGINPAREAPAAVRSVCGV